MFRKMVLYPWDAQLPIAAVFGVHSADMGYSGTGPVVTQESNPWLIQLYRDLKALQEANEGADFATRMRRDFTNLFHVGVSLL